MDILIKNIGGLPEDGNLTLTITPKGEIILGGCIFTSNFGKEVKAVALPEHGRLIDADELEGILDEVNGYGGASEITYKKMIEILHDETLATVIVEANNGSDN